MLRMVTLLVALLLGTLAGGGVAQADPATGSCTAVPNPVPVGTSYVVAATGLTVNTAFVVRIQQSGVAVQELFATSDGNGNAVTGDYGNPTATQTGTATGTWKKLLAWPIGYGEIITYGGAEATCGWTIVA